MARDLVNLIAMPHLDLARRVSMTVAPGTSVAEMVTIALPGLTVDDRKVVRVLVGSYEVLQPLWPRVRPKPGTTVLIRVVPTGSNLRSVLSIVVAVAAIAIAGPAAGALGFAAGTIGFTVTSALIATAVVAAGTLLVNALVPLKTPDAGGIGKAASPTYSINGLQNASNPNGVIPNVLGRERFAPPYAARPYTEVIGDDQYVIASFNFGYGPLEIDNHRLGDNSINVYDGVEIEVRQGYPDDEPLTLYPAQVIEQSVDASAANAGGVLDDEEIIRITARDTEEVSVDFAFPQGLVHFDGDGDANNLTVEIRIRQRALGDVAWSDVTTLSITAADRKVLRRTHRWTLPSRGQYEVGVTRITPNFTSQFDQGALVWTAIRSHRPEYPINFDHPLALVAVRIKATGQLQGIINNYNANATRIAPDYDVDTGTWITRATRNPAAQFRYIQQSPANAFPKTDAQMAGVLADLADWHEYNTNQGLHYDRIHDYDASLWDVLTDCAAAGRATPRDSGEVWGVVIDRPRQVVVGHITPRNSKGFSGERFYLDPPDGFRVSFRDETNAYQVTERVIPWPGFVGDPDRTEEISLIGFTNPAQVFREVRRRQYELQFRLDRYNVTQDVEGLIFTRGDLAVLNHDVLNRAQKAARVLMIDGHAVHLDDTVTIEDGVTYGVRFRLADGTSLVKRVVDAAVGETSLLRLVAGSMPQEGDLAAFGVLGSETLEAIVQSIEPIDGLDVRLTLADHAPQIEDLINADTLPEWAEGTDELPISKGRAPTVPGIAIEHDISNIFANYGIVASAAVTLTPGGAGGATPNVYQVQHRLSGATPWNTIDSPAAQQPVAITGYTATQVVEIRARALSSTGVPSDYTDIETVTITA